MGGLGNGLLMLKRDTQSVARFLHEFLMVVKMEKPKSQKSFECYTEEILIFNQFHILVFKSSEIK